VLNLNVFDVNMGLITSVTGNMVTSVTLIQQTAICKKYGRVIGRFYKSESHNSAKEERAGSSFLNMFLKKCCIL